MRARCRPPLGLVNLWSASTGGVPMCHGAGGPRGLQGCSADARQSFFGRPLVPAAGRPHHARHREHDRHFDKHPHDGGKRCAGLETEQHNRRGDRQLKEVAGADQCGRPGHAPGHAEMPVQPISKARIEVHLNGSGRPAGQSQKAAARSARKTSAGSASRHISRLCEHVSFHFSLT